MKNKKNEKTAATQRRYKILIDFDRVYRFLDETYDPLTLNSYLLPQYFEYAHMHSYFDYFKTHRFGIWEDDGKIVGIACYEMKPGDCHMHFSKGYESILPELLAWAEKELSVTDGDKQSLNVWITDKEQDKRELLQANGYVLSHTEPVKVFYYSNPFSERRLPDGFTLIDGTNVDYLKLHHCFWKGFDHGDNPDDDADYNTYACNSPRANMSLMTIAVAPDGEYACALGMWFDEKNKYAYLEPLATIPKYRRMGLATVALTEAMKKTKLMGAEYCFGGGREFYSAIGFETICNRELWKKVW
jgi:GNAT superfamily N-acetyltransferase